MPDGLALLKQLAAMTAIGAGVVFFLSLAIGQTWVPNEFRGAGERSPRRGKSPLYWTIVVGWGTLAALAAGGFALLSMIPNSN